MTSGILRPDSDDPCFESHLEKQMGCMAGLFEILNLNHRIYSPRRISSIAAGSSSPSQRSDFSAKVASDMLPSSPQNVTESSPAAKTPVSSFDFREGIRNSWKLREAPRLSLDSRLKPSGIRTSPANHSPASHSEQSPDKNKRSPSVVARLMGVDNLPGINVVTETAAELRRSSSESRVSRDLNPFFISDPDFKFEPPNYIQPIAKRASSQQASAVAQNRSNFNPLEYYPEPNSRSQTPMHGETDKRMKMRGIEEPSRDLESLKQVLEALQLKGLLHSRVSGNGISNKPIVVMKPGPKPDRRWSAVVEEKRILSRRKNGSFSGANCTSPKLSPRRTKVEMVTSGPPSSRRIVRDYMSSSIENDRINTSSEICTSSIFDLERLKLENREGKSLLERCNKLLDNISEFTSTDQLTANDLQPSPVSVLDSSFLSEEISSPSPVKKLSIDFKDPFEEWEVKCCEYTDYAYTSNVVSALDHYPNVPASDVYLYLEQRRSEIDETKESMLNRRLLFDTINEIMERKGHLSPWKLDREGLIKKVWGEVSKLKDVMEMEDLNEFTCEMMRKDLKRGCEWSDMSVMISDTVLYVERLVFRDLVGEMIRDLVGEMIRELGDVVVGKKPRNLLPRRRLLF